MKEQGTSLGAMAPFSPKQQDEEGLHLSRDKHYKLHGILNQDLQTTSSSASLILGSQGKVGETTRMTTHRKYHCSPRAKLPPKIYLSAKYHEITQRGSMIHSSHQQFFWRRLCINGRFCECSKWLEEYIEEQGRIRMVEWNRDENAITDRSPIDQGHEEVFAALMRRL